MGTHRSGNPAKAAAAETAETAESEGRRPLPLRHISWRKAVIVAMLSAVSLSLVAPMVLNVVSTTPNTNAATDQAVIDLQTYASTHGDDAGSAAAAELTKDMVLRVLSDGSIKAAKRSTAGDCYYVIVPASADLAPTSVRQGSDADCEPQS